jgi:hypothetical protein
MRVFTAVAGVNTVLWVAFAPIIAAASSGVSSAWSSSATILTGAALVCTLFGAALLGEAWSTRVRWMAFSFLVAPFGPTCFWAFGVDPKSGENVASRGTPFLLAGSGAALLALGAATHVEPSNIEAWVRGAAGVACVMGLWYATLLSRGRSCLLPLIAMVASVGLFIGLNALSLH